ncbi:unnamed protein product, partial [Iphiclides podalirius]
MLAIVLSALAASVHAAPQYHFHHHHGPPPPFHHHGPPPPPPPFPRDDAFGDHYFRDGNFDTRRFWSELSRGMVMLNNMLSEFTKRFPSGVSSEGVDPETNKYKVTIPLKGFEEKDVVVKAREGVLMVQALSKSEGSTGKSYVDVRALPDFVNVAGSWTYSEGFLKIVFPLQPRGDTTFEISTHLPQGLKPESREVDNNGGNSDANVGVIKDDTTKETELITNEIPKRDPVEVTTHLVDLKGEVVFVPVPY